MACAALPTCGIPACLRSTLDALERWDLTDDAIHSASRPDVGRRLAAAALLACCAPVVAAPNASAVPAESGYVDLHVHTAGVGAGGSGAFVNREMEKSFRFPFYLHAFGVTRAQVDAAGDRIIIAKIASHIAASQRVAKAVVLALDGVVDRHGKLDRQATQVYMPNEFVARETAGYSQLCYGASINPYRPDALHRLRQAKAQGALLVKWIPNIMHIDPADPAIAPFYRELVALDMPLLSHAGNERSFATAIDEYGDPRRLALPLKLGVTVIAAHIATTGENDGVGNFERILAMFQSSPNLYADISSLTQINKLGYLERALAVPGLDRQLVFGTDWPLQFFPLVSPYYHARQIGLRGAKAVSDIANPWDRDVALKEALGVPPTVFDRSAEILDLSRCD